MIGIFTAAGVVLAAMVGAVLHELAHALVAKARGCETQIDWVQMTTEFQHPTRELETWEVRVISLAPQSIGVATLGVALFAGWWQSVSLPIAGTLWISFALMGSVEDYSVAASRGGTAGIWSLLGVADKSESERQRHKDLLLGLGLLSAAAVGLPLTPMGASWYSWIAVAFAGTALVAWATRHEVAQPSRS
jgi:hypothetical protein